MILKNVFRLLFLVCCCTAIFYNNAFTQAAGVSSKDWQTLENDFTQSKISQKKILNFQKKGQQKLYDFIDLVALASDPNLDSLFRKNATAQALALFDTEKDTIAFFQKNKMKFLPINEFLDDILKNENAKIEFEISDLKSLPFEDSDESYFWKMEFILKNKSKSAPDIEVREQVVGKVFLKKTEKHFGQIKKEVWEVFLGSMKVK